MLPHNTPAEIAPPSAEDLMASVLRILTPRSMEPASGEGPDGSKTLTYSDRGFDGSVIICKQPLAAISQSLRTMVLDGGLRLYNGLSYEAPITVRSTYTFDPSDLEGSRFTRTDEAQGLTYSLHRPSDVYLAFLAWMATRVGEEEARAALTNNDIIPALKRWAEAEGVARPEVGVFDLLREAGRLYTVRISYQPAPRTSRRTLTLRDFEGLAAALYFHLGYNVGMAITEAQDLDHFLPYTWQDWAVGPGFAGDDLPKRWYLPELVHYYQAGLVSGSPAAQFLSYYNIVEYFFEKVTEKNTIAVVRDFTTRAGFSYNRDADISALINHVMKNWKSFEDGRRSPKESHALILTLSEYVDPDKVAAALIRISPGFLDYYRGTAVPFVTDPKGETKLDFDLKDRAQLIRRLGNRIYKTRNAVVHSKSGIEDRYVPFRHDSHLAKEVFLLKAVAEEIIESTARLLQLDDSDLPF